MAYSLVGQDIVVRTAPGTKLTAALTNAVVGFEVDYIHADHTAGWSVLVFGRADEIRDSALSTTRAVPLQPWTTTRHDHFIKIQADLVSGRAFGPVRDLDDRA